LPCNSIVCDRVAKSEKGQTGSQRSNTSSGQNNSSATRFGIRDPALLSHIPLAKLSERFPSIYPIISDSAQTLSIKPFGRILADDA
jgi:hypothetical protein